MAENGIGAAVRRKEDHRFITGKGRFTDDLNRPRQLYAWIVRSPVPHARIAGIDTRAAEAVRGVVAVFTGSDMAADGIGGLPCGWGITQKDGSQMAEPLHPPLARDVAARRFCLRTVALLSGQAAWLSESSRAGVRGGARAGSPRCARILTITTGSSIAAMIFS